MTDENGNISTEYDYYFMGEKIEPTVIHEELAEGEYGSDTHYEWNGITSYWGEMWELIGFIRADFCSDITETYFLYGDWLSPYPTSGGMNSYEYQEHLPLTDREFFYNLAYMTDSYFLGSYNPASRIYEYWFLGAYAKPVIYLYPEEETEVSVQVNFTEGGELTCTYPEYGNGWEVTALPDGTIYDKDGNEYYCLYWEGEGSAKAVHHDFHSVQIEGKMFGIRRDHRDPVQIRRIGNKTDRSVLVPRDKRVHRKVFVQTIAALRVHNIGKRVGRFVGDFQILDHQERICLRKLRISRALRRPIERHVFIPEHLTCEILLFRVGEGDFSGRIPNGKCIPYFHFPGIYIGKIKITETPFLRLKIFVQMGICIRKKSI